MRVQELSAAAPPLDASSISVPASQRKDVPSSTVSPPLDANSKALLLDFDNGTSLLSGTLSHSIGADTKSYDFEYFSDSEFVLIVLDQSAVNVKMSLRVAGNPTAA